MICLGDGSEACQYISLGKFLDRSGKVDHVEVVRCLRCGHGVSLPPLPNVAFLYQDRESQDFQPDAKGLSHEIKDIAFRSQARKLLRQAGGARGTILDFGCGSGQFTRVLGEMVGSASEVIGADMHSEPPAELAERPYLGPEELGSRKDSFDIVIALHVLEHDDDADGLLRTISGYARHGGKVVIEVPNVDCVWARIFGKFWDAWYLPYHRHHFTRNSLVRLMQRNGLQIESVHGVTVPTMGRSFADIAGGTNNLFWLLLGILAHPLQVLGEVLTRNSSAIRVIAVRK